MAAGRRVTGGVERGAEFHIHVDGRPVAAHEGETIAAALVASGIDVFRHDRGGAPRGLFCGMGVCFECLMTVNGVPNVQACVTRVEPGMRVETQREREWRGGDR